MASDKKKENLTLEERLQTALVPDWEQPYKLPENWCWIYWGECGEFQAGSGFKKEYQGLIEYPIPFYKVGSLKYSDSNGILYDTSNTVNEEIRKKLKAALIPENSIIFAKIGEAIRLNRRGINSIACCIDNNLMSFSPIQCLTKYVYFWSLSINLYDYINATTIPAIRKSDLETIAFPLAPRAEQKRIVDRIESLFTKLDEVKQKAQKVLDNFEVRKAALLHKAFIGDLTIRWRKEHGVGMENWKRSRFDKVAIIKSNLVDPFDYPDFPHIAPDNIEKKTGVLLGYNTVAEDGVKSGKHRFYSGQILYSKIRPYLSKVIVVDFDGLCSADIYPIEAKENAKCLWYYMLSEEFLEQASSAGSRSVLPKINQKELSSLSVFLPECSEEQAEIVRILDNIFEKEQKIKKAAEAALENVELIKKSILVHAFRGELGTNDSTDNNAVELVKQILKEKTYITTKKIRKCIPSEVQARLETELERKIIRLYFQLDTESLAPEEILSVTSKKFEIMESLYNLEKRGIITKLNNGNYKLLR